MVGEKKDRVFSFLFPETSTFVINSNRQSRAEGSNAVFESFGVVLCRGERLQGGRKEEE